MASTTSARRAERAGSVLQKIRLSGGMGCGQCRGRDSAVLASICPGTAPSRHIERSPIGLSSFWAGYRHGLLIIASFLKERH